MDNIIPFSGTLYKLLISSRPVLILRPYRALQRWSVCYTSAVHMVKNIAPFQGFGWEWVAIFRCTHPQKLYSYKAGKNGFKNEPG
jgi:hypothetical protein